MALRIAFSYLQWQFFARSRVGAALPLLPLRDGTPSVGSYIGLTTAIFAIFSDLTYRLIAFGRDVATVRNRLRDMEAFFALDEPIAAVLPT